MRWLAKYGDVCNSSAGRHSLPYNFAARLATVLLPVALYTLSFGPACWLCERQRLGIEWVYRAYRPLVWSSWQLRQHDFLDPVDRYVGVWANDSLLYELRATEAYRPKR